MTRVDTSNDYILRTRPQDSGDPFSHFSCLKSSPPTYLAAIRRAHFLSSYPHYRLIGLSTSLSIIDKLYLIQSSIITRSRLAPVHAPSFSTRKKRRKSAFAFQRNSATGRFSCCIFLFPEDTCLCFYSSYL